MFTQRPSVPLRVYGAGIGLQVDCDWCGGNMVATTRQCTRIAIEDDGIELRMQEIGGKRTVAFVPVIAPRRPTPGPRLRLG